MKSLKFIITVLLSALLVINSPLTALTAQKYGHHQFNISTNANTHAGNYYGRSETLAPDAASAFKRMRRAAASAGVHLDIISGFRSYEDQRYLFDRQVQRKGSESEAAKLSAPPGHSEHHTGYALDIRDLDSPNTDTKFSFESTKAFNWLRSNASSYGFELSFPPGNSQGVSYEPWHWRYVGSDLAKKALNKQPVAAASSSVTDSHPVPREPNINDQSFGDFKLGEDGSVSANPEQAKILEEAGVSSKVDFKKGQSVADVLTLGDIAQYEPEKATLGEIAEKGNVDLEKAKLADLQLVGLQTVGSLADAVPGLPQTKVGVLQPFLSLAETAGRSYLKAALVKFADKPLADLLKSDPTLKDVSIHELALGDLGISAIPGLKDAKIGDFEQFENVKISSVPGMDKVKLGDFPAGKIVNGNSILGVVDVVYGPKESLSAYRPITGSDIEGFSVPCLQQKCAYLELTDPKGEKGSLNGARWIKGGKKEDGGMMVKGGHGILASFGGGKEPTGRMPFGPKSNIKVVLTDVDEKSGVGTLSLYLRIQKKEFGATPFIFGPIPFTKVKEKGPILIGIDGKASFKPPVFEIASAIADQMDAVHEKYPDSSEGTSFSGGVDCTKELVRSTGAGFEHYASQSIPLILKEAEKAKLSQNQIAYVLATARQESGMGKYMQLLQGREEWGGYHARGFVGLTHDFNYKKFSDILGIDLVNNPDLAAEPEIAAQILVQGMKRGDFTGKKLDDYINASQADFYNARAIINGVKDSASLYANLASNFQKSLKSCGGYAGSCDGSQKMLKPIEGGSVSSRFGWRSHPLLGSRRYHAGEDIGASEGTTIKAADCGQVVFADWEGGYGNSVVIKHDSDLYTRYAHQLGIDVKKGQKVSKGQAIGRVGSTGLSTGPHLHFEVRKGSTTGEPLDPKGFL